MSQRIENESKSMNRLEKQKAMFLISFYPILFLYLAGVGNYASQ